MDVKRYCIRRRILSKHSMNRENANESEDLLWFETINIARRARMFWETPKLDQNMNEFVDTLADSGDAKYKICMPSEIKDAKTFFAQKKQETEEKTVLEFSFVGSLFWMLKIKRRMDKLASPC